MTTLIAFFGFFIAAACAWGIATPRIMVETIVGVFNRPSGMPLAIGVRVVFGLVMILAAAETRYPVFFQILGYLMLVAAAAIPIIGKERLTRFIGWFAGAPVAALRAWLLIGLAFGLFIAYGAM